MYEMSGFAEKLNIQNFVNSTGNCVNYIYGLSGFAETLKIQNCVNSTGYFVHYMHWFSRFAEKFNIPKFSKFNGKLFTLDVQNV